MGPLSLGRIRAGDPDLTFGLNSFCGEWVVRTAILPHTDDILYCTCTYCTVAIVKELDFMGCHDCALIWGRYRDRCQGQQLWALSAMYISMANHHGSVVCLSRPESSSVKLGTGRINFEWSKEMSFVTQKNSPIR